MEQTLEESKISKRKQKRRVTSYLSNISKQIEKQGNQINKIILMIQSLQKQKQTRPSINLGINQSQFQSIKQIKSQVNQLQKQVTRIQNHIQSIKKASVARQTGAKARTKINRRASPSSPVKSRPKKTKLLRSIQSGKQKRATKNR